MDAIELYRRSRELTNDVVRAAGDEDWTNATPCTEWDVRTLVNHLTSEALWVPELLAGRTIEEVGDRYDGDVVGDAPGRSFDEASAVAVAAWDGLDSLDRIVHLSFGDVPAWVYGVQMGTDMLVHGWDIARGLGRAHPLPDDLARYAYEANAPMITDDIRATGIIGQEVAVPDGAPWGDRLLGLLGRDPDWGP